MVLIWLNRLFCLRILWRSTVNPNQEVRLFQHWTRKLSIVTIAAWLFVVVWRTVWLREAVGLSDVATSAALLLATVGGKSALSAYVNGKSNGEPKP